MIGRIRERVLQIMSELERLSEHDYKTFELALALFLRADSGIVADKVLLSDETLKALLKMVEDSDTLMSDDLKDNIDEMILWGAEND
jgi:hypothetical protein